jgi:hypothetical protein
MNDAGEQAPTKVKRPRRRQQVTAVLVGEIVKSATPAPIDDVFQAIRRYVESGLIDPADGLIREEFSTPKAFRNKKAINRLHELGLGKTEIAALRDELGVVPRSGAKGQEQNAEEDSPDEA